VTIFLLSYVLPKFTPLFTRQGAKLPLPTKIMMTVSDYLTGYWYVWVALTIALVVGFVFGRKTPRGRIVWDWFKINAPLIGPLFRKVTISRSIRTLGTMIASGVPMLDALRLCSEVAGNYFYEQLWIHVQDRVSSGDQICDALAGNPLFPPMLVQMISSGEQTGKLDSVLERVSTYFDHEVETSVKTVTSMIEPIMITLMGVVVGGIGMALMLPIFQLSKTH
jgi:type IV pilus assembly protein PilC